jgi:serine/threonine protein kinase
MKRFKRNKRKMGNLESFVKASNLELITDDKYSSVSTDGIRVYKWFYKLKDYVRELNVIKSLDSKYIVKVEKVTKIRERNRIYPCYVMPKYEFTLREWRNKRSYILNEQIHSFNSQIVSALKYLHQQKLCHGDIKPGNIMIHKNCIKIIDFGDSVLFSKLPDVNPKLGTEGYQAPELFVEVDYDHTVDIWAFGCMFYFLVTGTDLFDFDDIDEYTEEEAAEHQLCEISKLIGKVPMELVEKSPYDLTLFDNKKSIYKLPLLAKYTELLEDCLRWLSKDRITLDGILKKYYK